MPAKDDNQLLLSPEKALTVLKAEIRARLEEEDDPFLQNYRKLQINCLPRCMIYSLLFGKQKLFQELIASTVDRFNAQAPSSNSANDPKWILSVHSPMNTNLNEFALTLVHASKSNPKAIAKTCQKAAIDVSDHPKTKPAELAVQVLLFILDVFNAVDPDPHDKRERPGRMLFQGCTALYREILTMLYHTRVDLIMIYSPVDTAFNSIRHEATQQYKTNGVSKFVSPPKYDTQPAIRYYAVCTRCKVGGPNLSKCAKCLLAHFCGSDCQVEEWKQMHKQECRILREMKEAKV